MLTSPVVYGFSLSDKTWRKSALIASPGPNGDTNHQLVEFNIELVQPIVWNDEAFANLVLPEDRKVLLQSLVDAHDGDFGFDDFIQGKGQGLVINLFGPPGVGKTLSAEATSEHVRRPLYVIGGGDLGTTATDLDAALNRVFDIATNWKALVLIDEVGHSCSTSGFCVRLTSFLGGCFPRTTLAARHGAQRHGGGIVGTKEFFRG